tara:strand:+ start:128 stop:1276 length:1149 start_codon:yes stop_codon:yes gene_type:complete
MKNNVHIYPSPILFESRMFKIARSIRDLDVYEKIYILGISSKGLPENEIFENNIIINRLDISEDSWKKTGFLNSAFKTIKLSILTFKFLLKKRPSVIHAHNLASLPISIFYKIFYNCKVVYDTHEIETERESWSKFTKVIARFFEWIFIKSSDVTVVVNDAIEELYKKWYKVNVVSILNTPEKISIPSDSNYFRKKYKINSKNKIFVYTGVFERNRGIFSYINFIKKTNLDVSFVFIGFGEEESRISLLAESSDKFFVHKAVKEKDLFDIISSADYSLQTMSFQKNLSLSYRTGLGNKFFQSCMTRLPMIGGGFDYQKKMIKKYELGVTVNSDDFNSIEQGIIELLSMDADILKKNCETLFEEYNWENESNKIANYYQKYIF